jgi:vacuolar-type H+-ATPase subunit H
MTSIELFIEELKELKLIREDLKNTLSLLIGKYKEKHKQEIIDAYNKSFELRDKPYSTADKYYQETFVSKVSDEAPKCTCNVDSFLCQIHGTSDGKNIIAF